MGLMHIIFSTLSNYGRQFAFALAPIPAYLPQYWTLCNTNDPVLQRRKNLLQTSPPKSIKSGGTIDSNNKMSISHPGSNIKRSTSFEVIGAAGNSGGVQPSSSKPITEGGFSSTSIMILLLSHVFRLQYFFVSAVMSTFFESDDDSIKTSGQTGMDIKQKADRIHFDLVMQSVVMIGIQLMLLSAVTRRKRLANKKKVDDDVDYEVTTTTKVLQNSRSTPKSSSLSQTPFIWLYKPNQHWRWDTVHQHIELIFVIILVEYAICRYFLHPDNTISYIQTVKNLSVFLESCLALPQMILNYKRKSTDGLSLLMVIGWVLGDLLKLAYFVVSSYKKADEGNALSNDHNASSSSGMGAFMVGSIFALGLDSIVMMQLVKWYPTNELKSLMKKVKNSLSLRWIHNIRRDRKKTKRRISFDEIASP